MLFKKKVFRMKISTLLAITIGVLVINPRIDFQGIESFPKYIISCSTGWSMQWGKGFIGLFSLDSASRLTGNDIDKSKGMKSLSNKTRLEILIRTCR